MADETAEKVARRLSGKPKCPNCGYTPEDGRPLRVSDWNLMVAKVSVNEEGTLSDPDFEMTGHWKEKEKVTCPECSKVSSMKAWGFKWSWEE